MPAIFLRLYLSKMYNENMKLEVPLRVDFAGGWLDVPRLSRPSSYIVNCAITPFVTKENWPYKKCSGVGGSAAWAILNGKDAVASELGNDVGWQDPAVIQETGLCVWKSGNRPVLEFKSNPSFLRNKMVIYWTGKSIQQKIWLIPLVITTR